MFYYNKTMQKNISYKKVNYASFKNGINTDYDEVVACKICNNNL